MLTLTAPAGRAVATTLTLALSLASPGQAQPVESSDLSAATPVLAIVKVPKPWYAPRFVITGKMRDTMPMYAALPGLDFKAYSFAQADGAFGGLYLWKDTASARAWFSPAWFDRVLRERGVVAQVRFLEVVAAVDAVPGGTPADPDSPSVATLTFDASAAEPLDAVVAADRRVPGLLRRYHVRDDSGRAGIFSLWRDAAAARQQLDASARGSAEWFDTPVLLPNTLRANWPRLPGLGDPQP